MSSLVFLGFSVIAFLISFGLVWMLVPAILGSFFPALPTLTDPSWQAINLNQQNIAKWITPLGMTMGLFILVLKVLMVASVRGRD